jgi:hypothetical protein
LGGPIIKNKLFFFVNGEYENAPKPLHTWKLSTDGVANASENITRVTAADMDAFRAKLAEYGYDPGSQTDYAGGATNMKMLARLDWNINEQNKMTIRYNYTKDMLKMMFNKSHDRP